MDCDPVNYSQTDTVILDVRDRLARIEVKIDNTNEKLKDHDERITANRDDIEALKGEHVAYQAKVATYTKVGAALAGAGTLLAWFLDHAGTVASVATALPR